jgi:hypothetical protein
MIVRLDLLPVLAISGALSVLAGALPAAAKDKPQPAPQWAVDAAKTPTPAPAIVKDAPAARRYSRACRRRNAGS